MAKVVFNNAGIDIIWWSTDEGFVLRAYEDGVLMESSVANPNADERGNFIQRWL